MMKKIVLTQALLYISISLFAQTTNLGSPFSWNGKLESKNIPNEIMSGYDQAIIDAENAVNDLSKDRPWQFGYKYNVNYTLQNSGIWTTLPNGNRVWQLAIESEGALTINLLFDNYNLPEGAYLYLYDIDHTNRVGAYTNKNNRSDGELGSELVHGDKIIVEYVEPANVAGQGNFTITNVIHGYRSLAPIQNELAKALNDAGDCNIDVNCPLGNGWENEIRSVALIVVGGWGICTGALINNTCDDGTPYFLTANHCISGSTGNWVFRFNWDSPPGTESCATTVGSVDPGPPYDQTANGATVLVSGTAADHALLEIDNMTLTDAQTWNCYYAGWDVTDATTVTEATGIHHPSGDVKKICRENNPYHSSFNGAAVWWIDAWEEGVTEPGSSGSPLFDQNHRIIGQLMSGNAACSGTNNNGLWDCYGRLGVSWNNGIDAYLAPSSCGSTTTNDGWDPNTPISLNSIPDENICSGESVTLTASVSIMPEDNLVITGVFDGPLSGGTPKGVELYVINNISDLSQYGMGSANNGGGTDGEEFTFPAVSATAGQYIYVASDSAQFNNWFGLDADYVTGSTIINGDDAIELFYGNNVIDVFGDINVDGSGQPWEYLDGWAYRNNSTGPDGSTFMLSSWSFSGPNALDGESSNSTAVSPFPNGTYTHTGFGGINTYTMNVSATNTMDFTFTGDFSGSDPALNVSVGDTLIFNVNFSQHQFWINTIQGIGSANGVPTVTNNGANSGTIAWVPTAAGTYYYNCGFHSMMTNTITVGPPVITYVWDNGVTNGVAFTPTASTDYIVVATDTSGSSATDTVSITVNTLPTVDAGFDVYACFDDPITLNGSGAVSYVWDIGITDGVPFLLNPGVLNFTVTGTDANGCENTDQVMVTVYDLPIVDAGVDVAICLGDSVILNATGALFYTWDNSLGTGATHAVSPTIATTYEVTGSDMFGCMNTDQVVVSVNPLPTVSAGADQTICIGDAVILSGSGAVNYGWDNGVTDGVSFSPNATATYTVTGTDANGCLNSDQADITVNALPNVDPGADQTICSGDQVTLNGAGANSFSWDNGVTDGVAFSPLSTATYTLTGTDGNGCINTDSVVVIVNALPAVNAGADVAVCIGDSVVLNGSGATSYNWSPISGLTDPNIINPWVSPTTTTTYTVTGTDTNGCVNTDQVTVTVNPLPSVSAGVDQTVCEGDPVTLNGSGALSYNWDNWVMDGIPFPATVTTTYTVTGTDVNGCSATDDVVITVTPAPNVVAIAASDTVCVNWVQISLSGSPSGGTFSGAGVVQNDFSPLTAGVGTHDIVYSYTDPNTGCAGTDSLSIVVLECTSIESIEQIIIDLYPNPSDGQFTLQMDKKINGRIEITNNLGQVVIDEVITGATMQFDLSTVSSRGVYFVKVYTSEGDLLKLQKILYQ